MIFEERNWRTDNGGTGLIIANKMIAYIEQLILQNAECVRKSMKMLAIYQSIRVSWTSTTETHEKYYEQFVEEEMRVPENYKGKILSDFSIQTETKIDHNKPDLIFLEKKEICYIVDVACPFDPQIEKKEKDRVKDYTNLK